MDSSPTWESGPLPDFPFARPEPFGVPQQYESLRLEDPTSAVRSVDGKPARLVVRYDDVRSLLADERLSTDKAHPAYPLQNPFFGVAKVGDEKTFFDMDNPDHDLYRRMFGAEFSRKAVAGLTERIQAIVEERLQLMLEGGGSEDLVSRFAKAVPTRVLSSVIGVPFDEFETLLDTTESLISLTTPRDEAGRASSELLRYFLGLIERRREAPEDDLISHALADHVANGVLSDVQLASTCRALLVAGFETTASMISLGALWFMRSREQRAAFMVMDDAAAARAVEELLRHFAVAHVGRRRVAIEDVPVGHQLIEVGEGVILATDAADHDPSVFPDPDRVELDGRDRPIVAFGFGIHQCIGQNLARAEIRIALQTLFLRLPDLRLAVPVDELPFDQKAMAYGVKNLPVRWDAD